MVGREISMKARFYFYSMIVIIVALALLAFYLIDPRPLIFLWHLIISLRKIAPLEGVP